MEAVYGYCPICGAKGVVRARCPEGWTYCENNHIVAGKDMLDSPADSRDAWKVASYLLSLALDDVLNSPAPDREVASTVLNDFVKKYNAVKEANM